MNPDSSERQPPRERGDGLVGTEGDEYRVEFGAGWGMSMREDGTIERWEDDGKGNRREWTEGPNWFYLSFADDSGFLGGVYVKGMTDTDAYLRATALKLNPGGEVQMIGPLPLEDFLENVPEDKRERLLSREEVNAL